eukprot:scaffold64335_cov65-Phaeocystis_antarctica.AAC.7
MCKPLAAPRAVVHRAAAWACTSRQQATGWPRRCGRARSRQTCQTGMLPNQTGQRAARVVATGEDEQRCSVAPRVGSTARRWPE